MDNLGNGGSPAANSDKPIPFEDGPSAPTPAKVPPAGSSAPVSRAPLNLGGTGSPVSGSAATSPPAASHPAPAAAPRVQAPQAPLRKPVAAGPAHTGRISNCRTFFTKLHPGAIRFLDDQITSWLKENPGVIVKHTNVITGDIVDKKTEPNILVTVWY
ncbi:MAG: hypothetical protein JW955_16445 [Sedimentisphaerales bacterium]|nr:hypothetical protein [Sedimentisphaerales bacterium]